MKMDVKFSVTALCNKYYREYVEKEMDSKVISSKEIVIPITPEIAANFIFRFAPSVFDLPDTEYRVQLKFNNMYVLKGICLLTDEFIYVVKNTNQVLSDIVEGYIRTRMLEKVSSMLEFDYERALLEQEGGVIDEFALND